MGVKIEHATIITVTKFLVIFLNVTMVKMCPKNCLCNGQNVSCVGTRMKHVPPGIPLNTTYLDFSNNSLTIIRNQTQLHNLPKLRRVYLKENSIKGIEAGSFWGHDALMFLDLSFNDLGTLDRNSFGGLGSLETLLLNNNKRLCLDFGSLGALARLKTLVLGKTAVNFIPGLFEKSPGVIAPCASLLELKLWATGMRLVPSEALRNLPSLFKLDLSQNQIKCLPNSAFAGNTNLTYLDLSSNPITVVQSGAFEGLSRLSILLLDNTNTLTMLPNGVFDTFPRSVKVCLFGNKWNCDCHIRWLKKWTEDGARVHCTQKPNCYSPPNLKGNPLYHTPEELFTCDVSISSLPKVDCHSTTLFTEGYCRELYPTTTQSVPGLDLSTKETKRKLRKNSLATPHSHDRSALVYTCIAAVLLLVTILGSFALRQLRIQKKLHDQNRYFNISYENGDQQLRMAESIDRETETFY